MTDREKAIVMAYTGVAMLTGDKLGIFHKYIEDICERPIWTHELASLKVWEEIKEKSKNDFLKICATSDERPKRKWIAYQENRWIYAKCPECAYINNVKTKFCPNCGIPMEVESEQH